MILKMGSNIVCVLLLIYMYSEPSIVDAGLVHVIVPPTVQSILSADADGGAAYFYCEATSADGLDITWWHNGRVITNGSSSFIDGNTVASVIRLEDVKPDDAGSYHCIAASMANDAVDSLDIGTAMLIVHTESPFGFPTIKVGPKFALLEIGDDVLLGCTAGDSNGDLIEYSWIKDDRPVEETNRIRVHSDGILQISPSKESDEGRYECVATNDVGVTYSKPATVLVRECYPGVTFSKIGDQSVTEGYMDMDDWIGYTSCAEDCHQWCLDLDDCKAYSTRKRWFGCQCYLFSQHLTVTQMDDDTTGVTSNRGCTFA